MRVENEDMPAKKAWSLSHRDSMPPNVFQIGDT